MLGECLGYNYANVPKEREIIMKESKENVA